MRIKFKVNDDNEFEILEADQEENYIEIEEINGEKIIIVTTPDVIVDDVMDDINEITDEGI